MLKKIFIVGALVALTGCATHQQANTAVGAGTGAVLGGAMGGRGGALAGAIVGSMIGSQQPVQAQPSQRVYVERQVIVPDRRAQCHTYLHRETNCYRLHYPDVKAMCIEDARKHYERCLFQ